MERHTRVGRWHRLPALPALATWANVMTRESDTFMEHAPKRHATDKFRFLGSRR